VSLERACYNVGVPAYWGTIIPPLHHSLVGFGVMINQFEPLVRRGKNGSIEPLAAKAWEFSADLKTIRFRIDSSRRFSDGSRLCAGDFKRSWENGLRMQPESSNSSLSDALSETVGFSKRPRAGGIKGIRTCGDEVLEIEFRKPVRGVLYHLSGVRYSAYKEIKGLYIGTGPYVITEKDKELRLVPNKFYAGAAPGMKNARIAVVPPGTAAGDFRAGRLDAMLFAERGGLSGCDGDRIRRVFGQEGSHAEVIVNGRPGRFFSDSRHRLALQALLWKYFKANPARWPASFRGNGFRLDPQSFLAFQAGRLPAAAAEAIIAKGERHVKRLIACAARRPLTVCSAANSAWLFDIMARSGVRTDPRSQTSLTEKEMLEIYYKTHEADLLPMTISVYDGDPDTMYHVLGRNGAIFSPMLERGKVADMLEEGRKIFKPEAVAPYYRGVAKKILQEVPYVHLGYFRRSVAYNPERLRINKGLAQRNEQSLMLLSPK